jgi:hypothetical protein
MMVLLYRVNGRLLANELENNKGLVTVKGDTLVNDSRIFDPSSNATGGFNTKFAEGALVMNPASKTDNWGYVKGLYARNDKKTPAFKIRQVSDNKQKDWNLASCIIFSNSYKLVPIVEEKDYLEKGTMMDILEF